MQRPQEVAKINPKLEQKATQYLQATSAELISELETNWLIWDSMTADKIHQTIMENHSMICDWEILHMTDLIWHIFNHIIKEEWLDIEEKIKTAMNLSQIDYFFAMQEYADKVVQDITLWHVPNTKTTIQDVANTLTNNSSSDDVFHTYSDYVDIQKAEWKELATRPLHQVLPMIVFAELTKEFPWNPKNKE